MYIRSSIIKPQLVKCILPFILGDRELQSGGSIERTYFCRKHNLDGSVVLMVGGTTTITPMLM